MSQNLENTRRSACDRCRSQKLRCVRATSLNGVSDASRANTNASGTCERCLKARTVCVNTVSLTRKFLWAKKPQMRSSPSPPPPSERTRTQSHSHPDSRPQQYGFDAASRRNSGGTGGEQPREKPLSAIVHQQTTRDNLQAAGREMVLEHTAATSQSRLREESNSTKEITSSAVVADSSSENYLNIGGGSSGTNRTNGSQSTTESASWFDFRQRGSTQNAGNCSSNVAPVAAMTTSNTAGFNTDRDTAARTRSPSDLDHFDFDMLLNPGAMVISEKLNTHAYNTDAGGFMDMVAPVSDTQPPPCLNTSVAHGDQNCPEPAANPTEEYILRLSELSSTLLKHFSRSSSASLADILLLSHSPVLGAPIDSNPRNKMSDLKNIIGRVLNSSHTFLDILQYFMAPSCAVPERAVSECSYSDTWNEDDETSMITESLYPHDARYTAYGQTSQPSSNDFSAPLLTSTSGSTLPDDQRLSSSAPRPDFPTTLAMLSCYICLLQTYDVIFSQIYTSLVEASDSCRLLVVPSVLPGLRLGGFDLDSYKDLQIEVLIHISATMLERIELALGIGLPNDAQGSDRGNSHCGGILDSFSTAALLDAMYKQKDIGCSKSDGTRAMRVKQTMNNIQAVLRTSSKQNI